MGLSNNRIEPDPTCEDHGKQTMKIALAEIGTSRGGTMRTVMLMRAYFLTCITCIA